MSPRQRALLLAPEGPYPLRGGGALRTAALLEYLSTRYDLDAIVFRQPGGQDPRTTRLQDLTRTIHVIDLPHHSRHTAARALRNLVRLSKGAPPLTDRFSGFAPSVAAFLANRNYQVAIIEHFWCAQYHQQLARHAATTILDLHNIESVLHQRCAASEPWPVSAAHSRFASACRRLEQRSLPEFSMILVTSASDAAIVSRISPAARPQVYPNTIPGISSPLRHENETIAFSANMEYHPNTAAVRFFRHEIWPSLREQWPGLCWTLIGKNPNAVGQLVAGDPRIRLTGPVDDAIAELAKAKVAIVPLLAGSGTRVKILEAWAAGTPVVSTSIGAEGLPGRDGEHLLIADDPASFGGAISRLLASADLRRRLANSARALYERELTWEAGWVKLDKLGI